MNVGRPIREQQPIPGMPGWLMWRPLRPDGTRTGEQYAVREIAVLIDGPRQLAVPGDDVSVRVALAGMPKATVVREFLRDEDARALLEGRAVYDPAKRAVTAAAR